MIVKLILCVLLPTIGAQLVGPVRFAKECRGRRFTNDYISTDDGAIGCPNGYVIHIIAAYYGEDTDRSGQTCPLETDDCRIAVADEDVDYYYKDMVDNCEGKKLCSSRIYAKYLEDGCDYNDRTDYVLIEYRCVVKEHFDNSELSSLTVRKLTGHYFHEELCPVGSSIKIKRSIFFIKLIWIISVYWCQIDVPFELLNLIQKKCDGRRSCHNLTAQAYWSTDWRDWDGDWCKGNWSSQYMQINYDCVTDTRGVVKCNDESFDNAVCEAGHSVHIIEAFYGDIAALPESYDCPEDISVLDCRVNIEEDDDYYNEIMDACEGQISCSGLYATAGINTACQGDLGQWNEETEYVVLVYECVLETTIAATTKEPTIPSTMIPPQSSSNMKTRISSSKGIDLTTQAMTTNITRNTLRESPPSAASLESRIGVPVGVSLAVLVIVAVVITVVVVLVLRRRKKSHKDTPPANAVSNQIYMSQLEDEIIPGNPGNNNQNQSLTDVYAIPNKPGYVADNDLVISDNPMYASVPDPQPDSATILQDNPTYTEHMEDGREAVINDNEYYSNTDALKPGMQPQSGHVIAENGDVYTVPIRKQKDMEDDLVMVDNIVYN